MAGLPIGGQKYLLVKGSSGLGNRILSLLTGMVYARLAGRRLLVDWRDAHYSTGGVNVFTRYFAFPSFDPTLAIPDTLSVTPPIWRGHLHESAPDLRERHPEFARGTDLWRVFSIDLERLDYDETVAVMWTYVAQMDPLRRHFRGAFAPFAELDNETILRRLLRQDLRLQPSLKERVERFEYSAFRRPTVGVHVRYTDHRARLGALLSRLNRLLRRAPDLQIFLATDNRQIKRLFEANYPSVISTPHWYPPTAGRPLHTRREPPDPIERGAEALIDLYLLAACDYLIFDPSSSFGEVAALLSEAPPEHVIRLASRGKQPLPPDWMTSPGQVARWEKGWRLVQGYSYHLWIRTGLFNWGLDCLAGLWRLTTWRLRPSGSAEAHLRERRDGDCDRGGESPTMEQSANQTQARGG
jgi:hypothetical protein